jgi:hypothetical protein
MIEFKELHCLLPSRKGVCNAYLADVEAGIPVTTRFTCHKKHTCRTNRIEFTQDSNGIVTWRPLVREKKRYNDDNIRFQDITDD